MRRNPADSGQWQIPKASQVVKTLLFQYQIPDFNLSESLPILKISFGYVKVFKSWQLRFIAD